MGAPRRMALVVLSDRPDRLEAAAAFAASGAATGMAVHVLVLGAALAAAVDGRLPESAATRLAEAREAGTIALYACSAAYGRLSIDPDRLLGPAAPLRFDAVVGIPTFLEHLSGADVQLVL